VGGGFWVDGQDQNEYESSATPSSGGAGSWNNKIETDDTAKAYRRYYMGRVSSVLIISHAPELIVHKRFVYVFIIIIQPEGISNGGPVWREDWERDRKRTINVERIATGEVHFNVP